MEKQNRESFKKQDHEKRKVDEATEKAKELMRVKTSFCVEAVASINDARAGDVTSDWSFRPRRDAKKNCGIPFVVIVHFHRITTLLVQLQTQFW